MAVIREIAFGDGSIVRITDWGDYPLFSSAVVQAADLLNPTECYMFNYMKGGQIPFTNNRATEADTNMPAAGQLPMGHQMLVYSIQAIPEEFAANAAVTLLPEPNVTTAFWKWRQIFYHTYLSFVVEQTKAFAEGPLAYFPAGGGFIMEHNAIQDNDDDQGYALWNGDRTWEATRLMAMPIHLGSLETFYVSLKWPRGALPADGIGNGDYHFEYGFNLTVRLTGPRQRPTA